MSRVKLVVAASAALLGIALAGCSALPDWATPSWIAGGSSGGAAQPLRFESDPPGADVRTAQGQTCLTPCAIPVPSEPQAVTITKIGFVPQTVQVTVGDVPEHSFWEAAPPPALVPNPVQVVLQPVAPPRPVRRPRPRGGAVARSAPRPPRPMPRGGGAVPPPPQGQPDPAFPPPQQGGSSPFPPPPAQ